MNAPLLASSVPPWDWRDLASCTQVGTEVFFPQAGCTPPSVPRICQACRVRGECLEFALAHGCEHGIWGGLSATQRKPWHDARAERLLEAGLKICAVCAETKPLDEFSGLTGLLDGWRECCRACLKVMPETPPAVPNAG